MQTERLETQIGFSTDAGRRRSNDDFAATCLGTDRAHSDTVAVIADGVGESPNGRLAAETTARGFLDGYYSQPATLSVDNAALRALMPINRWVHAQGRQGASSDGLATTFTALILRGRQAHVVHVGDTRLYRLRSGRLERLTQDHNHNHPDLRHVLLRAVGLEETLRADYARHGLQLHDRFLLCCDGIHASLPETRIRAILAERAAPAEQSQRLVDEALAAGSQDNVTALVVDVVRLPLADRSEFEVLLAELPIAALPQAGDDIDGFRLHEVISDGRYSRLFRAEDGQGGGEVILKFPHPRVAQEQHYRRAFAREAWVTAQVRSPYVCETLELAPGRQTRLYLVMPYYPGETLAARLRRMPAVGLPEGVEIAMQLCKAVYALHRSRIVHRDIKPENVLLTEPSAGGRRIKLLDLGVVRLPDVDPASAGEVPGTPSFMAPELFDNQDGDERSDVYALGVTLYTMFSAGHYPYGEVEAFSHPRFNRRQLLSRYRPELPAWLDEILGRAVAVLPADRYGDAMELAFELENGLARGGQVTTRRRLSLLERNPVRFWQMISVLLATALILVLAIGQ